MIPERLRPILDEVRPLAERFDAARPPALPRRRDRPRPRARPAAGGEPTSTSPPTRVPSSTTALVRGWADAVWDQGARFGTVGLKKGDTVFEITTHRAEAYTPDSRKPEVSFADEVEADLSRRDFTVNAMALRVTGAEGEAPELIDPFGGVADLAAGVLRTPAVARGVLHATTRCACSAPPASSPATACVPDDALVAAVDDAGGRLEIVSAERDPRRARQAARRRRPEPRACGSSSTRARRRGPARAAGHAGRAGPDPPPQGRARPHHRGRGQDAARR